MYEITETDAKTASVIRRRAAHEKEAPAHADAAEEFTAKRSAMMDAPFLFFMTVILTFFGRFVNCVILKKTSGSSMKFRHISTN